MRAEKGWKRAARLNNKFTQWFNTMPKMLIRIDPKKCRLSGECIKLCPQGAIFVKEGKAAIDLKRCDLDGMCIPACPMEAIYLYEAD